MITKKCLTCGKEFKVYNYRKSIAKFCSSKCKRLTEKQKEKLRGNKNCLGNHHSEETKQKIREANTGEKAHNWKGDNAKYRTKHSWVIRHFGKPTKCENCGKENLTGRQIHWHNLSGKYLRNRKDWMRVCQPCHCILDGRKIYFCTKQEYKHQWYLKNKLR